MDFNEVIFLNLSVRLKGYDDICNILDIGFLQERPVIVRVRPNTDLYDDHGQ